ncbi:histone H3-like centromeric protein CSE4 [Thelohanellus kitauei]|uniref:Histone H3-like centromeric protein CSE4 n=1 Tax=Thelohanellus kitauei TaxID=669202 RepID=A0A0C2JJI2_THEKT|nr:histone H3-like centromeric protein CSE4 [Thelohanellus kitauei]
MIASRATKRDVKSASKPAEIRPIRSAKAKKTSVEAIKHQKFKKTKPIREIIKFQKSTDLLIPRASFSRLVREVAMDICGESLRFELIALLALHEAAEAFLVRLFEHANLCALHAKRVTLMKSDIALVEKISSYQ